MSEDHGVEIKQDALNVVDSWLGASSSNQEEEEVKQPVFERRAQRLGLGAKYVPHKKVEAFGSSPIRKTSLRVCLKRSFFARNAGSENKDWKRLVIPQARILKKRA